MASFELDALLHGTPFRAVARIGAGGMGEIYEAIGPFGGDPVVVKLLRAELTEQADLVERLRREGEMLQWLTHPNIVVSHGHGTTAAGRPYVVMERLVGATLRQELTRRGALPVREAVGYVRQLLAALGAVHGAGVVHRDIKPGNVMVCPEGNGARVKLFDFGVAKVAGEARHFVAPVAFPTREGICLGTPRYVSPEQARGLDVDWRSDIYAVGILLYTLVAGRGPFDDIVGAQRLLQAHIAKEAPPPSRFMATPLHPFIETAILRAIAKNPAQRFSDVATFGRELGRAWGRIRGSRRLVTSRGISLAAPYAPGSPTDRCRIRTLAPAPPRVAYHATATIVPGPQSARGQDAEMSERETAVPIAANPGSTERAGKKAHPLRASISRRGVCCSAAAFFAIAGGLAMWFVR